MEVQFEAALEAFIDIDEIAAYIAQESPKAAHQVVDDIYQAIQSVAPFPYSGHRRNDLTNRQLRFIRVRDYPIAYAPAFLECVRQNTRTSRNARPLIKAENERSLFKSVLWAIQAPIDAPAVRAIVIVVQYSGSSRAVRRRATNNAANRRTARHRRLIPSPSLREHMSSTMAPSTPAASMASQQAQSVFGNARDARPSLEDAWRRRQPKR